MVNLNLAGQRFIELLDLVNHSPLDRCVGQQRLPFRWHFRSCEIGNQSVAPGGVFDFGDLHYPPLDIVDRFQAVDVTKWDDGDAVADIAMDGEIEAIAPQDMDTEPCDQR